MGCSASGLGVAFVKSLANETFDDVSVHPYRRFVDDREFLADLEELSAASRGRKVWMTEIGWDSFPGYRRRKSPDHLVSLHEFASLMARAYLTAASGRDVRAVFGYDYVDDGVLAAGYEEIRRWGMMCLRHYALEGGTDDLAAAHGFVWNPELVRDGDFAAGLENWTASGAVAAETIAGYGARFQTRKALQANSAVGDTVATFTTQAESVGSLSQRLTGLKKGRYYSAFCCVLERDGLTTKKYVPPACDFSIRLEGAVEVPCLRYELCRGQRGKSKATGNVERILRIHILRYVFRAEGAEATLILQDRDDSGSVPKTTRRQSVNFVMVKPYYLEDGELPETVADSLLWRTEDRRR